MIYKGLMGKDEIDYLTNRFTEIKFTYMRIGTEFLATEEMLSRKDISPEVYTNILNDNREGVLKLISHSQGLIAFDYDIIGGGKKVFDYLNEVLQGNQKVILLNVLTKSFDTGQTVDSESITRINTESSRDYARSGEFRDYSYTILDNNVGDEDEFKRAINFNSFKNIVDGTESLQKVIVTIYPSRSEYGFRIGSFPVETIPSISKLQKSEGINILSKTNAPKYWQKQGVDTKETSEIVKNDLYILAPSIDFYLDFDEKYGVSPEAFPLFRRWAKKLVKRKMKRKDKSEDTLAVFSLNDSYVDKGLNNLFGLKPINTQYTLFSQDIPFKEWASKKLMQPTTIERIKSSLEDSVKIFKETTGKYKPLPRKLFNDKKYENGKRLLGDLITAKIGLAMGDRSGWTKRSSRPPSLQDSSVERYPVKKSLPDLSPDLSFLVKKGNKKGYDSFSIAEKGDFAAYWVNWAKKLDVFKQQKYKIFDDNAQGVDYLIQEIFALGIYPNQVDPNNDSVFVFSINMFSRDAIDIRISSNQYQSYPQDRKRFQNFIFIINYDRQEISVSKYGGQDDAKQFSINFQDFDIRVDIVNLINRIISEPKNLITNLPEKPYYAGREGYTSEARVSMTPEEVATAYTYTQADSMKNHKEVLYHESVGQDTLTGRRTGFMVFREVRGGYGFFSFDPFYHDKDGHRGGVVDICITPLNNLFTPINVWAESNNWFDLEKMPDNLFYEKDTAGANTSENILKYISDMCEAYLSSTNPKLYPIREAVCVLLPAEDSVSPDAHWLLGNRGEGEGEVFPISVNAYSQLPSYAKEKTDKEVFSVIISKAWNTFFFNLDLLKKYPDAMETEPAKIELERLCDTQMSDMQIASLERYIFRESQKMQGKYKELSNKLIKEYLKQNPPTAGNLATRRQ